MLFSRTISSTGSSGTVNYSINNSATNSSLTINNTNAKITYTNTKSSSSAAVCNYGNITLSAGNILGNGGRGISQHSGDIKITGGEVSGNYGISPYSSTSNCGTITLGINDGSVPSTTSPKIYGSNIGISNANYFSQIYFYDGQVVNDQGNADYGLYAINPHPGDSSYTNPIKTPVGYDILLSSDKTTYTLGKPEGVPNAPNVLTGMTPIKFDTNGTAKDTIETDSSWYAYIDQGTYKTDNKTSRWANVRTKDGSQWVWIPRFAYKILSQPQRDSNGNATEGGEINIIFLKGTSKTEYIDPNGITHTNLPDGYIVHPAFTDESKTAPAYKNGGWDSELTGIWVAKYEAGFAGVGDIKTPIKKESSLTYTGTYDNVSNVYGKITSGKTKIAYPVFMPNAYSYNYISIGDCYSISKALTSNNNPYGLTSSTADTHMIKNSEWGAVTYLAQSKYGRNGIAISANNRDIYDNSLGVQSITGYGMNIDNAKYNSVSGQLASTTGNLYGIYDMSGGAGEYTAGYLKGGKSSLSENGQSLLNETSSTNGTNKMSTKYISVYEGDSSSTENYDNSINKERKGEAIWEISTSGDGNTSWFNDRSTFVNWTYPFFTRGGYSTVNNGIEGVFYLYRENGKYYLNDSFRAVCVSK